MYRGNNFVKTRYISEFSILDDKTTKYDWAELQEKYPALKIARNIDHWVATFGKSKRNNPDLLRAFKTHCLSIKSENSLRKAMNESCNTIEISNMSISIITGDCCLLEKVVPRAEYRKYSISKFVYHEVHG